jgi:hypothetical protein
MTSSITSIYSDDAQTTTSRSPLDTDQWKATKSKLKNITDPSKMREFIIEHYDELTDIPIALLNAICKVDGYKFTRQRGITGFSRKADSRHNSAVALRQDMDQLKSIIYSIVQLNGLKLPD